MLLVHQRPLWLEERIRCPCMYYLSSSFLLVCIGWIHVFPYSLMCFTCRWMTNSLLLEVTIGSCFLFLEYQAWHVFHLFVTGSEKEVRPVVLSKDNWYQCKRWTFNWCGTTDPWLPLWQTTSLLKTSFFWTYLSSGSLLCVKLNLAFLTMSSWELFF